MDNFSKNQKYVIVMIAVAGAFIIIFSIFSLVLALSKSKGVGVSSRLPLSTTESYKKVAQDVFDSGRSGTAAESEPPSYLGGEGNLTQRKVVKNGSLSILVSDVENAVEKIKSLADRLDGFISNARVYEVSSDIKSGTIIIRVPAARFEDAISEIKNYASKVENEHVTTQDITEQYIDLEARLKNYQAQEKQYLEIMDKAETVEDTLSVVRQLDQVRSNIERIQGQLQYLSSQVEMSTITISLTAEADVEVFGIRWRPLFVVKQSFRNMLTGLTGFVDSIIGSIFKLPVLLLWLATIVLIMSLGWHLLLWGQKKFFRKAKLSKK